MVPRNSQLWQVGGRMDVLWKCGIVKSRPSPEGGKFCTLSRSCDSFSDPRNWLIGTLEGRAYATVHRQTWALYRYAGKYEGKVA